MKGEKEKKSNWAHLQYWILVNLIYIEKAKCFVCVFINMKSLISWKENIIDVNKICGHQNNNNNEPISRLTIHIFILLLLRSGHPLSSIVGNGNAAKPKIEDKSCPINVVKLKMSVCCILCSVQFRFVYFYVGNYAFWMIIIELIWVCVYSIRLRTIQPDFKRKTKSFASNHMCVGWEEFL